MEYTLEERTIPRHDKKSILPVLGALIKDREIRNPDWGLFDSLPDHTRFTTVQLNEFVGRFIRTSH